MAWLLCEPTETRFKDLNTFIFLLQFGSVAANAMKVATSFLKYWRKKNWLVQPKKRDEEQERKNEKYRTNKTWNEEKLKHICMKATCWLLCKCVHFARAASIAVCDGVSIFRLLCHFRGYIIHSTCSLHQTHALSSYNVCRWQTIASFSFAS